jgi:pyruvate/2-oxoglutarate dehydrogenase complex dihydrolipoamide dehydrogenase (E3) component
MASPPATRSEEPYDLVVIGGGSAGLAIGKFAPKLDARVAIVEQARLGGDCTWYGCVPSKALIAAGRAARSARETERYGLPAFTQDGPIDLARVMDRVHNHQQSIYAADDAPENLECDVIEGRARFVSPTELEVDGRRVHARFYCVATGASPDVPPIAGLDDAGYLTNETIFTELRELPARLVVIGGGAVGVELGQALARLGSAVTIVEPMASLLPSEDPELVEVLRESLAGEGVRILTGARVERVYREGARKCATVAMLDGDEEIEFDALLVATGRRPNVDGLGLDAAGVAHDAVNGIDVDETLRTSNPRVYAAGDVICGYQFTHVAAYEATQVMINALLLVTSKVDYSIVPSVTFTDPEIASVGMNENAARARFGDEVQALRVPFSSSDRAVIEGKARGVAKLVTRGPGGRILGAHIAGPSAGELIHEYALAIREGVGARELGELMHAYPTLAQAPQMAAIESLDSWLDQPMNRRFVRASLRVRHPLARRLLRGVANLLMRFA